MPALPSLGKLREHLGTAERELLKLAPGVPQADSPFAFFFAPDHGDEFREISRAEFDADEPPPGLYRIQINGLGETPTVIDGAHYLVAALENHREHPANMARSASVLVASAVAESERRMRVVERAEAKLSESRRENDTLREAMHELRAENARLRAELDSLEEDGSMSELGSALGQVLVRVLDLDGSDDVQQGAVATVVTAMRKDKRVIAALTKAGAGDAIKLLMAKGE